MQESLEKPINELYKISNPRALLTVTFFAGRSLFGLVLGKLRHWKVRDESKTKDLGTKSFVRELSCVLARSFLLLVACLPPYLIK